MPYLHVTRADRLPAILKQGLGCSDGGNNWEFENGVYIASDLAIGLAVMLQHYCNDDAAGNALAEEVASWRCIVVDDSRIRVERPRPDPEFPAPSARSMIHDDVVDVRVMPMLDVPGVFGPDPASAFVSSN